MARSIHKTELPRAYTLFSRFLSLWERIGDLFPSKQLEPRRSFRPLLEGMEERVVPNGRPLPNPLIYMGAGAGAPIVKAFNAETGELNFQRLAYDPSFNGGVRVATGDFTGDGFPDVVTAPGAGGGPHIRIFDGKSGKQIDGPLGSFWAFSPSFSGGVNVAAADIDGDDIPDVIAAAGPGGGPHVKAFSGATGKVIANFMAFDPEFHGGITVAAADLTGDGLAEIAVGAGPTGSSHIKVYNPLTGIPISGPLGSFFAFGPSNREGVFVGADALAGDVNNDGTPDLAVGTGPDTNPRVKVFSGSDGKVLMDFAPFAKAADGGVRVALAYVDDDPFADVVTGTGPGVQAKVKVFSGKTGAQLPDPQGQYLPFGNSTGGVFFGASNDPLLASLNFVIDGTNASGYVAPGQVFTIKVQVNGSTFPTPVVPTGTVALSVTPPGGSATTLATLTLSASGTPAQAITAYYPYDLPDGTYTFGASYSGDSNYDPQTNNTSVSVLVPVDPVPAVMPPLDSSGPFELGVGLTAFGESMTSAAGVTIGNGAVTASRTDLTSSGFGTDFGERWSWTSSTAYGNTISGDGATQSQVPHLKQVNVSGFTDLSIGVILDGSTTHFFDYYEGSYHSRYYDAATLTHDSVNHLYIAKDGKGNSFTFNDFSTLVTNSRWGLFESMTDTNGNSTTVTSWDITRPLAIERTVGSGSGLRAERFTSTYLTTGANTGLLVSVTQEHKEGTGSYQTVRSAHYTYYDGTSGPGTDKDLKLAVVKDASGNTIDTTYYRYYTSGTAIGLMKFAFGPDAYSRLTTALGTSVDSLTDTQVDDYADKYLEYDSTDRATKVVSAADGCSACTGGLGEFSYAYTANASFVKIRDMNRWANKTVETLPDGNTNTYYTNWYGQVMLRAFASGGQTWHWYTKYDDAGRVILSAGPSAVSGFSESNTDLVGYSGSTATYLRDAEGLVATYTYATSTTATTSTAGDVAGRLKDAAITRGETGTAVPQSNQTYIKRTAGGVDYYLAAGSTVYRNTDGTGGQTTSAAYTWQGSTAQHASITVTLPTVTTAQNGPNTATSATTHFDSFGRAIWSKDAAGFLSYSEYDTKTGAVVKTIQDVNHATTADFANLPSGWTTPSGGGLHLITAYEVDGLGRTTKTTHSDGRIDYTVYDDDNLEVRFYPGWNTSTNLPTGPTMVSREDRAGNYSESLTMSATPAVSGNRPTGTESIASLQSLSRTHRNAAGQTVYSDAYFNLSGLTYSTSASFGTSGTHYYRTESVYDSMGRLAKTVTPQATIYRTVFDGLGRPVSEWIGTDDTPTTGFWSPTNLTGTNTVKVREYAYDGGGVGDGNLTKVTDIPGLSAANRVTETFHDWRNRAVATKSGVEGSESTSVNRPIVYADYDNLGQVTKTRLYDGDAVTITSTSGVPNAPSASLLRAQSAASYDELGRAYRQDTYSVDPSSGTVGSNTLHSQMWFDARGQVIKSAAPGGLVQKMVYDGVGRTTVSYASDGGGDSGYSDADDVTGDLVLEQSEPTYDAAGRVLSTLTRQRFHDASGTGALGSPSSGIGARVTYAGYYYDAGGRTSAVVNVGTNGGSSWTRPGSVPSRSDTVLVTSQTFDDAGRVYEVTDPRGLVNRTLYDALGRTTKTIQNYVNGTVSDTDDKTVEYAYNSAGMTTLTAKLTGGGGQTTQWVYGVTQSSSGITSNDIVGATKWPDKTTGAASSSEQETVTVNALGQTLASTDRNGSVHTLSYDVLGRIVSDAVTTLGSGVDGAVRRIETAYDSQGNPYLVTSYDAASSGSIVNQIQRVYNGLGQLITEYQSHSGAVNTSTTSKVQYAYSEMPSGANHSRLTSITYPSGYVLTFNFSSGINSDVSRLSSLSDSTGTLESYSFLGLGTVVIRSHLQPTIDLSYVKQGSESTGDAGDQYTGLDRFGRVVDQRWINTTSSTATDRFQYGYDRDGNRLYRDNLVNAAFGEVYTYDGLNQLASFNRGTLNSTKTGIAGTVARSQAWDYDALGNFDSVTTNGGSPVTRSANAQNQLTSISGSTTPTYDANGSMTGDETGKTFVFDPWNRLVKVKSGSTTLESFSYDGLNRRVTNTISGTTTDLYYSSQWQVLEEKVSSNTTNRYVWSPVYVDAMILRDRDTDANGTLDERQWVEQDVNWNVTALINGSGTVVERYGYDAFGVRMVYDATYNVRTSGSSYDFQHGFQGRPFDAISGTNNFRNREVSPILGRPIQVDMLRFGAGDMNFYRWEGNNPVNWTDPSGLDKDSLLKWLQNPVMPGKEPSIKPIKPVKPGGVRGPGGPVQLGIELGEMLESTGWGDDLGESVGDYFNPLFMPAPIRPTKPSHPLMPGELLNPTTIRHPFPDFGPRDPISAIRIPLPQIDTIPLPIVSPVIAPAFVGPPEPQPQAGSQAPPGFGPCKYVMSVDHGTYKVCVYICSRITTVTVVVPKHWPCPKQDPVTWFIPKPFEGPGKPSPESVPSTEGPPPGW